MLAVDLALRRLPQAFSQVVIPLIQQEPFLQRRIECGRLEDFEAHHNPPALQLLRRPDLPWLTHLQQFCQSRVKLAERHRSQQPASELLRAARELRG